MNTRERAQEWLEDYAFYDAYDMVAQAKSAQAVIRSLIAELDEAEKQIDCRSGDEGCNLRESTGVTCYCHLHYYCELAEKTITTQADRIKELEHKLSESVPPEEFQVVSDNVTKMVGRAVKETRREAFERAIEVFDVLDGPGGDNALESILQRIEL